MFPLYSLLLSLAFLIMLPLFLLRRNKYASGFRQRLGQLPDFKDDGRPVIWLHCVSVGELNAARSLIDAVVAEFSQCRLVVSTTTRTGQELARTLVGEKADAVFYFPFDWKFSVRRALKHFKPSLVLIMETEIWPRFIREAHRSGASVVIVNGRLSAKSFSRYSRVKWFVRQALAGVNLAVMQDPESAKRIVGLGLKESKVQIAGNLKFDSRTTASESDLTARLRERFDLTTGTPLVVAASTHDPEETWLLEALCGLETDARMLIAPRHPERFDDVARSIERSGLSYVRRTNGPSELDSSAKVILLDSIGELRAVYPLAEIVFVGGSLIKHGGQSILEPAAAAKAIVTGPYTQNFEAVIEEFLDADAILQIPPISDNSSFSDKLREYFHTLLNDAELRNRLGRNASSLMQTNDRGATSKTIELIRPLIAGKLA